MVRPYDIDSKRIRLGIESDGGYVLNRKLLSMVDVLYSYGVGSDVSFEFEFNDVTRKEVRMYDHTIKSAPFSSNKKKIFLKKEGLSLRRTQFSNDFLSHVEQNGHKDKNVLLKIDIEGYELEYFSRPLSNYFREHVLGIILEVHDLDLEEKQKKCIAMLKNLENDYVINHTHGNNFSTIFKYNSLFPKALELTFMNRRIVNEFNLSKEKFPIKGLDFPNNESLPDINLWLER